MECLLKLPKIMKQVGPKAAGCCTWSVIPTFSLEYFPPLPNLPGASRALLEGVAEPQDMWKHPLPVESVA